jgi:hypothetical protein
MICQIFSLNLPAWRTAMSRKTAASTMMAMYVIDLSHWIQMRVSIRLFLLKGGENNCTRK